MKSIILHILLKLVITAATADPTNKVLRKEIEDAAAESKTLADELEAMLLRLEGNSLDLLAASVDEATTDSFNNDVEKSEKIKEKDESNDKENLNNVENVLNDLTSRIQTLQTDSLKLVEDTTFEDEQHGVSDFIKFVKDNDSIIKHGENAHSEQGPQHKDNQTSENNEHEDFTKVGSIFNELSSKIHTFEIDSLYLEDEDSEKHTESNVKITQDDINGIEEAYPNNIDKDVLNNSTVFQEKRNKNKKEKEDRLKSSFDKLAKVAKEIEKLAKSAKSDVEIETVHQLTEILQEMTSALSLEEVRLSVDVTLSREEKIDTIEENIEYMLEYLREVMEELKEQASYNEQIALENKRFREAKFLDESPVNDVIILVDDVKDCEDCNKADDRDKRIRQARYRNMLTKFYFGSYWKY